MTEVKRLAADNSCFRESAHRKAQLIQGAVEQALTNGCYLLTQDDKVIHSLKYHRLCGFFWFGYCLH